MQSGTVKRQAIWAAAAAAMLGFLISVTWRADAARITQVTPQGKVAQVRQVVVKFDESMVAFGAPDLPAPARIKCNDASASAGQPRWIDGKTWAWDFTADLPPGVACSVDLNDGLKSSAGQALTGPRHYTFETGGPFVQNVQP